MLILCLYDTFNYHYSSSSGQGAAKETSRRVAYLDDSLEFDTNLRLIRNLYALLFYRWLSVTGSHILAEDWSFEDIVDSLNQSDPMLIHRYKDAVDKSVQINLLPHVHCCAYRYSFNLLHVASPGSAMR